MARTLFSFDWKGMSMSESAEYNAKPRITSIEIALPDGTKIHLSPEDAKALHDELAKVFAKPVTVIHDYTRPWYMPYWPVPPITWATSGGLNTTQPTYYTQKIGTGMEITYSANT